MLIGCERLNDASVSGCGAAGDPPQRSPGRANASDRELAVLAFSILLVLTVGALDVALLVSLL